MCVFCMCFRAFAQVVRALCAPSGGSTFEKNVFEQPYFAPWVLPSGCILWGNIRNKPLARRAELRQQEQEQEL